MTGLGTVSFDQCRLSKDQHEAVPKPVPSVVSVSIYSRLS